MRDVFRPLISVIIPVYNGEKTLIETLSSVLKQTYAHFEVIIIDDGSDNPVESFVHRKRLRDDILTTLCVVFTFAASNYKMPNYVKGRIFHPDCVIV